MEKPVKNVAIQSHPNQVDPLAGAKQYLTPRRLVELGLFPSEGSVRIAVYRGQLPAMKRGSRLYFLRSDIDEWMDSKRIPTLE